MKNFVTIIGVILLCIVIWLTGPLEIILAIKETNWLIVPSLLLVLLTYYIQSLRFRMLMGYQGIRIRRLKSFYLVCAGAIANLVAPVGGGDVVLRPILFKKVCGKGHHETFAVVLIERFMDFCGLLSIAAIFAWSMNKYYSLVLLLGLCAGIIMFNILKRFRYVPAFAKRYAVELRKTRRWPVMAFIRSGAYTVIGMLSIVSTLWLVGLSIGAGFKAVSLYFVSVVVGLLTFIPGGLGVTDGTAAALFTLYGLDPVLGVTMALLMRFLTIVAATAAFLLLKEPYR